MCELVSRDVEAGLGQKEVKEKIISSTLETAGELQGPHHGGIQPDFYAEGKEPCAHQSE